MNELDRQLIGYAVQEAKAKHTEPGLERTLSVFDRVAKLPDQFGKGYSERVVEEYNSLLGEVADVSAKECAGAFNELLQRAVKGDREWQTIDTTDSDVREAFARALKGIGAIDEVLAGDEGGRSIATSPDMMGPIERGKLYARIIRETKKMLGLEEEVGEESYSREDLLDLMGHVAFINPNEIQTMKRLMEQGYGGFRGRFSDEMLEVMDAFGGREGGTYEALMSLSDISKLGMEDYGKLLGQINPHEHYFLSHLPFKVVNSDGRSVDAQGNVVVDRDKAITITIAEVTDFLLSPEGKKYFRMSPHEQAKFGISEYIKWLRVKYPKAEEGLEITSNYQVITEEGKRDKAGVLDEGKRGTTNVPVKNDLTDVYVEMAANPTWYRIMKLARANVNILVNRGLIYRGQAVFGLGPDLQKSANTYPFYVEAYTLFDAYQRLNFPKFRSLSEYLGNNSNYFGGFFRNKINAPDLVDPFHPREFNVLKPDGDVDEDKTKSWRRMIEGGMVEPKYNDSEHNLRMNNQFDILNIFYALEPDPASTKYEEAVATLIARGAGRWVDELNVAHNTTPLTNEQQIELAWSLHGELRAQAFEFGNVDDKGLETMQQYLTFYPLPPELSRLKLKHVPDTMAERLKEYNFKGKVVYLGGPDNLPDEAYMGVGGLKLIADNLGTGLWKIPKYGDADKNKTQKHAGYEEQMVEVYQLITKMAVGSTQSKMGEVEEEMARSLAHGRQDLSERTTEVLDKLVLSLRGIQANPNLRAGSWKEFSEAYLELIQRAGFMTGMRGVWWAYRYGCVMAEYMAGMATSLPYLSGSLPYREFDRGGGWEKSYIPVTPGQRLATYAGLYKDEDRRRLGDDKASKLDNVSNEALAILNCYKDVMNDGEIEIVSVGKASGLHPVAMVQRGGGAEVSSKRVNVADQFGHMRQLPKSPETTVHLIREALFEAIPDLKIDTKSSEGYYKPGLSSHH